MGEAIKIENIYPSKQENTPELRHEVEEAVRGFFELMVVESPVVNEGNNGIIKKVDAEKMPVELIEYLNSHNERFYESTSFALKILKIYTNGKGKEEYERQLEAFELVDSHSNKENMAKVPRPLLYAQLKIEDKDALQILREQGLKGVDDRIEVLLMDMIPGDDIAEIFFKEVIVRARKDPKLRDLEVATREMDVDKISFPVLHEEVARLLGFYKAGGKHRNEDMRINEEEAVKRENSDKIRIYLEKSGYRIPREIIEKVRNTVKLLHDNNLYHRDLHERNIMVSEDEEVYIIDFGSAQKYASAPSSDDEVYEENGAKRPRDSNFQIVYRSLLPKESDDSNLSSEAFALLNTINSFIKRLSSRPQWKEFTNDMTIANPNIVEIAEALARSFFDTTNNSYHEVVSSAIYYAAKNGMEAKEIVEEIIEKYNNKPSVQNIYRKLHELISNI